MNEITPKKSLETLALVARQYKGTFEEHQHLDECLTALVRVLAAHGLDKDEPEIQQETLS